jgi:hypothetical protein
MERLARPGSISGRSRRDAEDGGDFWAGFLLPMCCQFRRPIEIGHMEFLAQFVDSSTTG